MAKSQQLSLIVRVRISVLFKEGDSQRQSALKLKIFNHRE